MGVIPFAVNRQAVCEAVFCYGCHPRSQENYSTGGHKKQDCSAGIQNSLNNP